MSTDRIMLALGDGYILVWFYAGPNLGGLSATILAVAFSESNSDSAYSFGYPRGFVVVWEGTAYCNLEKPTLNLADGTWRLPTAEEWADIQAYQPPWPTAEWCGNLA